MQFPVLQNLDLSGNNIGSKGGKSIARWLIGSNYKLRSLRLGWNSLMDEVSGSESISADTLSNAVNAQLTMLITGCRRDLPCPELSKVPESRIHRSQRQRNFGRGGHVLNLLSLSSLRSL